MLKPSLSVFAGLLMLSVSTLALADAAGTANGVNPAADAALEGQTRTLKVGSDIFIGDQVQTGPKGQVQVLFNDKTELVIGPKSSLKIADYLVRNNGDPGKFVIDALSGTFRFATGDGPKNKYQINTPTGTIGVRGTGYDIWVTANFTRVMMYNGITRDCSVSGQCVDAKGLCTVAEFDRNGAHIVGDSREIGGAAHRELRQQFRYATNQSPLIKSFWMTHALECLSAAPNINVTPTISDNTTDHGVEPTSPPPPPSSPPPPPPTSPPPPPPTSPPPPPPTSPPPPPQPSPPPPPPPTSPPPIVR
jgi:hypothetical protein